MTEEALSKCLEGCRKNDRQSQKALYQALYGYAMSICVRYAGSQAEAAELVNDGFFKVLTQIHKYDPARPFRHWLGRIMCNTAIDYYRSASRKQRTVELEKAQPYIMEVATGQKLDYERLLSIIQQLPPVARTVFNLFVIDGFTHEEIAARLRISVGTSRSNLFKARQNLQQMIRADNIHTGTSEKKDVPIIPINQNASDNVIHSNSRKP